MSKRKQECALNRRVIQDFQEVISGKWKLPILITLSDKPFRFKELSREIGISPRMLSKELQDLEMNKLVIRTVYSDKPVSVEYSVTEIALKLEKVITEIVDWGNLYRKSIRNK